LAWLRDPGAGMADPSVLVWHGPRHASLANYAKLRVCWSCLGSGSHARPNVLGYGKHV